MIQPRDITLTCGAGGKTVDVYAVVGGVGLRLCKAASRFIGIEAVVSLYMS